jgi:DNA-binding NtrC family response regulator
MSNILIVDDEQSYRQLLSLVFEGDGHTIRTASNGREALELLQQEPADVVISDVRMPDMDGIEMLSSLRETQPDLGVVLMTAFASVETAREAFKLGADDFIQKPFDVE